MGFGNEIINNHIPPIKEYISLSYFTNCVRACVKSLADTTTFKLRPDLVVLKRGFERTHSAGVYGMISEKFYS